MYTITFTFPIHLNDTPLIVNATGYKIVGQSQHIAKAVATQYRCKAEVFKDGDKINEWDFRPERQGQSSGYATESKKP